jgi:hypothetical protein
LAAIKEACELNVGITTLHKYLKYAKFYRALPVELGVREVITPMKQNGGGVMLWGCMTSRRGWGPLTTVEGTINGD